MFFPLPSVTQLNITRKKDSVIELAVRLSTLAQASLDIKSLALTQDVTMD